jgi:hypothetical protein
MKSNGVELSLLLVVLFVISTGDCKLQQNAGNGNLGDFQNVESFENRINTLKRKVAEFYKKSQFQSGSSGLLRVQTGNTEKIAKIKKIMNYLQSEAGRLFSYLESKGNVTQDKKELTNEFIDFIQSQVSELSTMLASIENENPETPPTQ